MFHFVCSADALTPELESDITTQKAWVEVIPRGSEKPNNNAGGILKESFSNIKDRITQLESLLFHTRKELKDTLKKEEDARKESDLVLANRIAEITNLLREKDLLKRHAERTDHANTLLYQCQICMERQRNMRLAPCGHMATCPECTEQIMNRNGLCPLCRTPVTNTDRTYMS